MYTYNMKTTTHTPEETKQLGREFATQLQGGDVVCLHGNLGAGKTTFVKGLAEGLGITEEMTSPTFTLMNMHSVQGHASIKRLVHIDTYRLNDERELLEIGVEDYLGQPDIVTLIEWPEKLTTILAQKKVTNVSIDHSGVDRQITIAPR